MDLDARLSENSPASLRDSAVCSSQVYLMIFYSHDYTHQPQYNDFFSLQNLRLAPRIGDFTFIGFCKEDGVFLPPKTYGGQLNSSQLKGGGGGMAFRMVCLTCLAGRRRELQQEQADRLDGKSSPVKNVRISYFSSN